MAESNVISKLIRLILDKNSAKQVEDETKSTLDKVDAAWKDTAKKIAGYLGVAFLTKKIIDFGKAAVEEAMNSQAAWSDLAGTIDANGESFDKLEAKLRATGEAFQDAFGIDNDKFASSLSRVITLTGDVTASTQNMGLVANVAAKFFNGDLAPAADLVAKAMNGNVTALQKMGIHATSAQGALDVLAQRSMGAAEKRAGTFAGQLEAVNNQWSDFLKDVGFVLIQSEGATTAFNAIKAAIQVMAEWVENNRQAIALWVTKGINFAIDAADVFYRALVGMTKLMAGGLQESFGILAKALAFSARGWVGIANAASLFLEAIGAKETSDKLDVMAGSLLSQANALDKWADAAIKAGSDKVFAGIERLATTAFTADQFKGPAKTGKAPATGKPVIGSNAELSDAEKAWQKFDQAIAHAKATITGTHRELEFLQAQASAISDVMADLAKAGVKPTDEAMTFLASAMGQVNAQIEQAKKVEAITQDFKDFADATAAATAMADSHQTKLQSLQGEQQRLTELIKKAISDGLDPEDEALQRKIKRLHEVEGAITELSTATALAAQLEAQAASDLAGGFAAAFGSGFGQYARGKAKQNYLQAAEDAIMATFAAFSLFGAPAAPGLYAKAAAETAMGLAWSAFASEAGGGGAPATISAPSGSAAPGSSLSAARSSSSGSVSNAKAPEPITEIHFIGPGFDALNPKVQAVVIGAQQQALELNGPNANVRVIRRNS
jgi:hypothetical protein